MIKGDVDHLKSEKTEQHCVRHNVIFAVNILYIG